MELREKIARALFDHEWGIGGSEEQWQTDMPYWLRAADVVLAIPEIADALKHQQIAGEFRHHDLVPVKPLNLGPSVSTGKRDPV